MREPDHKVPEPAHARNDDLMDPKTDGPFLDEVRAAQEDAYREVRNLKAVKAAEKKSVKDNG